tara:strand:- start:46 stop:276 length:231 start_codon:yes stop_codon:yes gene_type:complete
MVQTVLIIVMEKKADKSVIPHQSQQVLMVRKYVIETDNVIVEIAEASMTSASSKRKTVHMSGHLQKENVFLILKLI